MCVKQITVTQKMLLVIANRWEVFSSPKAESKHRPKASLALYCGLLTALGGPAAFQQDSSL